MHRPRGTQSLWQVANYGPPRPSSLTEDAMARVCIIGAGIAGLTTAYLLTRAGQSVIVVDQGPPFSGESGRTTGHLSTAIDRKYKNIEKLHGQTIARLAAESHREAIDAIEEIITAEGIDCDFERLSG